MSPFFLPSHRTPIAVNGTLSLPSKGVLLPFMQSGWGFCSNGSGRRGGGTNRYCTPSRPFLLAHTNVRHCAAKVFFCYPRLDLDPSGHFLTSFPLCYFAGHGSWLYSCEYISGQGKIERFGHIVRMSTALGTNTRIAWHGMNVHGNPPILLFPEVLSSLGRLPQSQPKCVHATKPVRVGKKKSMKGEKKKERGMGCFSPSPCFATVVIHYSSVAFAAMGHSPIGKGKGRDFTA